MHVGFLNASSHAFSSILICVFYGDACCSLEHASQQKCSCQHTVACLSLATCTFFCYFFFAYSRLHVTGNMYFFIMHVITKCMSLFISAGPITKLCARGGRRILEDMCCRIQRDSACMDLMMITPFICSCRNKK